MIRCGLPALEAPSTTADHLFLERLKLLVIMTKAALKGYPVGDARAKAIRQNAHFIFHQSLDRSRGSHDTGIAGDVRPLIDLFYQRTQLLAIMASLIADGKLTGIYRKRAVVENIDHICDHLCAQFSWADALFLKVA